MKITLTGSLGNISKPLAKQLIAEGHQVTIISSNPGNAKAIEALGATPAIGSVSDVDFLSRTFTGADAVYTMVPPHFAAENVRRHIADTGRKYVEAIKKSGVDRVVNLSSIGAHLDGGTGPISGLHDVELAFEQLEQVAVSHIRASFFMTNFLNDVPMVKQAGIIGANYPGDARLVMVHPVDIAATVADELVQTAKGKKIRYIAGDEQTLNVAAGILGAAIGKPDLPWVTFTDDQSLNGMMQASIPEEMARNYVEMGTAIRSGILWEDYDQHRPATQGKIKLEDFAKEFAENYNQ